MKAAQLNVTEKKNSNRRLDPRLEYGSGILFQSKGDKPIKLPWIIQGGMGTGVSNWQQVRQVFTYRVFEVVYGTALNELIDNLKDSLEV